jgi:hypothetical protein
MSAIERDCGIRNPDAAEREFGAGKLGPSRERRRHNNGSHVKPGQRLLGSLKLSNEEMATRPDQAGVERIRVVAERVEHLRGSVKHVHRPCQIACGERDLGLGDLATGLGEPFANAEAARSASQEIARPLIVAELGHRNAAQGERRRVVAQRDAIESAQRITGRQRARGRSNEGIHVFHEGKAVGGSKGPLAPIRYSIT